MIKKKNDKQRLTNKKRPDLDKNIKIIENLTNAVNKLSLSLGEHKKFIKKTKVFDSLGFLLAVIFMLMTIIWCQRG